MFKQEPEIHVIIIKYFKDELSGEERTWLEQWRHASDKNEALFNWFTSEEQVNADLQRTLSIDREAARSKAMYELFGEAPVVRMPARRRWWKYIAAAAVIVVLLGAYFWISNSDTQPVVQGKTVEPAKDIIPGSNKAILTLGDKSTIVLDDAQNGQLTQKDGAVVTKKNGALEYTGAGREMVYNILSTPKGGQYQLVLPDGSKVWLNAASSIRYPVAFAGNERQVSITGEVYFEVAKDAGRPFVVSTGRQLIQVMGTKFNINAYTDEPAFATTLLEGSVKVGNPQSATGKEQFVVIKPGQQAILSNDSRFTIADANVEQVMAWKNGIFFFKDDKLKTIMRQIARWYDVDVVFDRNVKEEVFSGKIPRSSSFAEVLSALSNLDIKFEIKGRQVIIEQAK